MLGPSGAGKTTTLRMIAGLATPTEGRVLIDGRDMTWAAPRDRNVAMVYDKNSLYPHLTAYENMAYPLRLRKLPEAEIDARVRRVAETLRISELVDRAPRQLSGGQQQRVAIGRMLVRDAGLFLMDEPISHLDAKLRSHMRLEFRKLQREFSATILYVSHDQVEAMTMGDRVVVIDQGVAQQIGAPREIFEKSGQPLRRGIRRRTGDELLALAGSKPTATLRNRRRRFLGSVSLGGSSRALVGGRRSRADLHRPASATSWLRAPRRRVRIGQCHSRQDLCHRNSGIDDDLRRFGVWTRGPRSGQAKTVCPRRSLRIDDPVTIAIDPDLAPPIRRHHRPKPLLHPERQQTELRSRRA